MTEPDESAASEGAAPAREQRRRAILSAAVAAFARNGYDSASISDIIERAGIARGTFYLYFSGKQEAFDAIFADALRALRARIRPIEVGEGAPSPRAQLRAMLVSVLDYAGQNPDLARLFLSQRLPADPEVAARVDVFWEEVRGLLTASLVRGVDMGLVRPLNEHLCASALLGAVLGVLRHLLSAAAPPTPEVMVEELIDLSLRGVGQGWLREES